MTYTPNPAVRPPSHCPRQQQTQQTFNAVKSRAACQPISASRETRVPGRSARARGLVVRLALCSAGSRGVPGRPPPPRLGRAEGGPGARLAGASALPGRVSARGLACGASPSPCRRRRRCRRRCANQLEVLLRVPSDRSKPVMEGPVPPPLPARRGRSGGHTGGGSRGRPRPPRRSQLPGSTLRPPPRTTTAGLTVPATQLAAGAEPGSHPRRRAEDACSPSFPVNLQHGFRLPASSSPPPYSGARHLLPSPCSRPTAACDPGGSGSRPSRAQPAPLRAWARAPARAGGWPGPTGPSGRGFPWWRTSVCQASQAALGKPAYPWTVGAHRPKTGSVAIRCHSPTMLDVASQGSHPEQAVVV